MVDDQRHGGSCSIFASLATRGPPAHRTFHDSGCAFGLPIVRTSLERALHPTGSRPRHLSNKTTTQWWSLCLVDDQGLEHWFDSSNPVKRGGTATSSHPFLKLSSKIMYRQIRKSVGKTHFGVYSGEPLDTIIYITHMLAKSFYKGLKFSKFQAFLYCYCIKLWVYKFANFC